MAMVGTIGLDVIPPLATFWRRPLNVVPILPQHKTTKAIYRWENVLCQIYDFYIFGVLIIFIVE